MLAFNPPCIEDNRSGKVVNRDNREGWGTGRGSGAAAAAAGKSGNLEEAGDKLL